MKANIFYYETPVGKIGVAENGRAITHIFFGDGESRPEANLNETALLKEAALQLQEYFEGRRKTFNLPLDPGGTPFQQKVWQALQEIPYGQTRSYKDIAIAVGNSKASRAVGMANNRNPISIVIPCHRVIGSNGKLTGYGGGLHIKEYLLNLEKQY